MIVILKFILLLLLSVPVLYLAIYLLIKLMDEVLHQSKLKMKMQKEKGKHVRKR